MKAKRHLISGLAVCVCGCVILAAKTLAIEPPNFPNDDAPAWIPERQPIYAHNTMETLIGRQGVRIYVELSTGSRIGGLTEKKLQSDAETLIRKKGIRVFSAEDSVRVAGRSPKLHIIVGTARTTRYGGCGYSVTAALWQWAETFTGPRIFCSAITWIEQDVGFSSMRKAEEAIREAMKGLVDKFCDDWATANPDKGKRAVKGKDKEIIKGTGTIRFAEVEGGCYVIDADNGISYDPINMPQEYKEYAIDGLRVKFEVVEMPDMVSIYQTGIIVEIIIIEKIEETKRK